MHDDSGASGLVCEPSVIGIRRKLESLGMGQSEGDSQGSGAQGIATTAEGSDALAKQVGGDHYKSLAIQPVEFIVKNGIPFLEANAIKYLVRHNSKGGAADIRKAIHYCELLLSLQYGEKA